MESIFLNSSAFLRSFFFQERESKIALTFFLLIPFLGYTTKFLVCAINLTFAESTSRQLTISADERYLYAYFVYLKKAQSLYYHHHKVPCKNIMTFTLLKTLEYFSS